MQVSVGTVNKDIFFLRQKAKSNIERYVNERLPEEYEKCLVGLTAILKEAWDMSNQVDIENKEKVQALSLAKDCYSMKLDLLTNATVVEDAIRFVADRSKDKDKDKDKSKDKEGSSTGCSAQPRRYENKGVLLCANLFLMLGLF